MYKSIKLLFFILLTSFFADKVIYHLLNVSSDKVYSGQAIGKLNQYLTVKDTLELIVFGNSRANHHIDVRKLANTSFNMGIDGTFIAYSSTLIKLLPLDKKQLVILHVDPKRAFNNNYKGLDIDVLKTKYHRNSIIKNEIDKLNRNNCLQKFYWSIAYNGTVLGIGKNYIFPKYDHKNYYGYDPIKVSNTQREILEKILLEPDNVECQDKLEINPLYEKYLKEIKSFCSKNNKKLFLVTSPTYDPTCIDQFEKLSIILKEMGIDYLKYSTLFTNSNSLEYWKDKTHLSEKGAEIFSIALSENPKIIAAINSIEKD